MFRHCSPRVGCLCQRSKLGSQRPNPSAMWLSGSGRPPLCMHCLSKNHLAANYPHTGNNLSSLAPQWAVSSSVPMHVTVGPVSIQTCGTTLKSTKISTPVANPLDLHTTNGSQFYVGYTMHQRGQGATMTLANLLTTPAHVGGDLIPPSCTTCHSIERN